MIKCFFLINLCQYIGALTTIIFGIFFSVITGCNEKEINSELTLFRCSNKCQKKSKNPSKEHENQIKTMELFN